MLFEQRRSTQTLWRAAFVLVLSQRSGFSHDRGRLPGKGRPVLRFGSRSEESLWVRKTDADAANCDDDPAAGNAVAHDDSEDSSPSALANADCDSASNGNA